MSTVGKLKAKGGVFITLMVCVLVFFATLLLSSCECATCDENYVEPEITVIKLKAPGLVTLYLRSFEFEGHKYICGQEGKSLIHSPACSCHEYSSSSSSSSSLFSPLSPISSFDW